jgi:SAM-dependent methyltransferase
MISRGRSALARYVGALFRYPAEALERRIDAQIARSLAFMNNASLSGKLFAYDHESPSFALPDEAVSEKMAAPDGLPVPPPELWEGYGPSLEDYLSSGREHFEKMTSILGESGFAVRAGQRVLDFGCSAGRLIRYFAETAADCEVRGVDISAKHIFWCRHNLSPPFRFTHTTTFPHLPFEDGYFDLIYSGSVFTHIADLSDAWLLELKRILRPGGMLYVTVHDEHTIDVLKSDFPDADLTKLVFAYDAQRRILRTRWQMFTVGRSPRAAMVFYHGKYLAELWSQELTVRSVTPEAYGYQSAVLLQK